MRVKPSISYDSRRDIIGGFGRFWHSWQWACRSRSGIWSQRFIIKLETTILLLPQQFNSKKTVTSLFDYLCLEKSHRPRSNTKSNLLWPVIKQSSMFTTSNESYCCETVHRAFKPSDLLFLWRSSRMSGTISRPLVIRVLMEGWSHGVTKRNFTQKILTYQSGNLPSSLASI